jgi:hypothetical protein
MIDMGDVLAAAAERLNSAYAEFEEARNGIPIEFNEMRLQASIFQYDICAEMTGFLRNAPSGFARNVALKGLIVIAANVSGSVTVILNHQFIVGFVNGRFRAGTTAACRPSSS